MSPETIALLFKFIQLAIAEEPAIALELHNLFTTPNPSAADWQALREKVLGESFEALAPHAAANLPPKIVTPPAETAVEASQAATALMPDWDKQILISDDSSPVPRKPAPAPEPAQAAEIPAVAGVVPAMRNGPDSELA